MMKMAILALGLISTTAMAGSRSRFSYGGHIPHRVGIYCTSYGMKTALMNDRNELIQEFTFSSDCQDAIKTRMGDLICSSDVTKNKMLNVRFAIPIKDFTFKSDCISSLQKQKDGFTCAADVNNIELFNLYRVQPVRKFTFMSDCMSALDEASSGLICTDDVGDSTLIGIDGQEIQRFTFKSDCEETRRAMLGGGYR